MRYRRELDGLRALAILPVLIFHLNASWLPGGYLGVDVFFVISGFLITGILIKENENQSFSFLNFYAKRIRRLFPALVLMLAVVVSVSFFYDSHAEFKFVNQAAVSVLLFLANVFFNIKSDYFNHDNVNPLLHTWSLANEEQYYFFMPLFIYFCYKYTKNFKFLNFGLLLLCSCSFFLFIKDFSESKMDSFFLFPHRFWELGVGSLIALNICKIKDTISGKEELVSLICLNVIFISYFFDPNNYDKGYLSYFFITVASAFFLVSVDSSKHTKLILSIKPIVFIGLISYSLYLWHQPIIIYSNKFGISYTFQIIIIALITIISYKFEAFFRKPNLGGNLSVYSIYASVTLPLLAILLTLYFNNGNIYKYNDQERVILEAKEKAISELKTTAYDHGRCFLTENQSVDSYKENKCLNESQNILLIGDSEAAHLYPGLKGRGVSQVTMAGCRPLPGKGSSPRCRNYFEYIKSDVIPKAGNFNIVIISANWNNSFKSGASEFKSSFEQLLDLLVDVENVYVVSDLPNFIMNPYDYLIKKNLYPSGLKIYVPVIDNSEVNILLKELVESRGHTFIEPVNFCREEGCLFVSDGYLFHDFNHLNDMGSRYFSEQYLKGASFVP